MKFANQLRDQGLTFRDALVEASQVGLGLVIVTGITTAAPVFRRWR